MRLGCRRKAHGERDDAPGKLSRRGLNDSIDLNLRAVGNVVLDEVLVEVLRRPALRG